MQTKLLDHLVSVGNKSGAMPAAPAGLKTLKAGIEGVPFSVDTPGMSRVLSLANMVPNLVEQIKDLGSLAAVGEFKNILGRLQGELAGQNITQVSPEALTAALEKAVDVDELREAVGDSVALMHSLKRYSNG